MTTMPPQARVQDQVVDDSTSQGVDSGPETAWPAEPTLRVLRQFRGAPLRFDRWFASNGMTVRVIGMRESGKSNVLEQLGLMALRSGSAVLDIASARDSESLAVLLGPFLSRVRLIVADSCSMSSSAIELQTVPISQFGLPDDGHWYVLPRAGFPDEASHAAAMKVVVNALWSSDEWSRPRWLLVREAEIFLSSISRTTSSRSQRESSDALQQLNAEARHHGVSLALDSQREVEVSKSLRQVSDVLIVKKLGSWIDFPEDLRFVFSDIEPEAFRFCPVDKAYIMTSSGQLAFVHVPLVSFHHRRGRSILSLLGISVRFDEQQQARREIESAEQRMADSRVTVTPLLHLEIVRLRETEERSFDEISLVLGIASSTVKLHYRRHAFNRERGLPCPSCGRTAEQKPGGQP